jgi:hypothetical protein
VAEGKDWQRPFQVARNIVRGGDFDEIKKSLESLGFKFSETSDPNHWMYFHPVLKEDPIFRYPRNLYRPHGSRRSTDRVSKHDQSQAKQMIDALRAVQELQQAEQGESDE